MAHELSIVDGQAKMLSVRETPWHRLGTVLEYAPSYEEAIHLVGLDYEVEKAPTYRFNIREEYNGAGFIPTHLLNSTAFVTVRKDTGKELGSVGPGYEVVQNIDAFAPLKVLIEREQASIETAGILREGEDAWMLLKFEVSKFDPKVIQELGLGEELLPYAMISTNHSGRRGILMAITPVRVVCANTLGMVESEGKKPQITVRHTSNALDVLKEEAERLFQGVLERYALFAEMSSMMKDTILPKYVFNQLVVQEVSPDPRLKSTWNPEARMAATVVDRHARRVGTLASLWQAGTGHTGDGSAWEAYNGCVEAIDHHPELWPTRSGVQQTERLLTGELSRMKTRVLENIVGYCKENRN